MKRAFGNRQSNRLDGFDYGSPGAYFITILCRNRNLLFGLIASGKVALSELGEIAKDQWIRTFEIRAEIAGDEFVVMPNHLHAILWIVDSSNTRGHVRAHCNAPLHRPPGSLGSVVSGYKGAVTREARAVTREPAFRVWHRNYFDRVIRSEDELDQIRRYIRDNPQKWELDKYYSQG